MKHLTRGLERLKQQHTDELVLVLLRAPDGLSADALGEATHLRAAALPLLARLHKRGFVEPQWSDETLLYRLSPLGRDYAAHVVVRQGDAAPRTPAALRPLFARLATLLSRADAG